MIAHDLVKKVEALSIFSAYRKYAKMSMNTIISKKDNTSPHQTISDG